MRLPVLFFASGGLVFTSWVSSVGAEETTARPDMRRVLSGLVAQRTGTFNGPAAKAEPKHDPDVLTLPPVLVNAAIVKVPTGADTLRPVVHFVRPVSYPEYVARDQKQQEQKRDFLDLADLARLSGDAEVAEKMRKETYRALVRDPTPLERAMDRSANGGRY